MRKLEFRSVLCFLLMPLASFLSADLSAAPSTLLASTVWLSHPKLKPVLAQPGGLAQVTKQVGHFVVESYVEVTEPMTVLQLASFSDAIVLCKVLDQASMVDMATNIVTTRVRLQADEQIKGVVSREFSLEIPGGRVFFDRGSFAEIHTVETKGIGNGSELIVFVSETGASGIYQSTNGMEGIFNISLADGSVTSITKSDGHPHFVKSVSMTLAKFRKQLASASSTVLQNEN